MPKKTVQRKINFLSIFPEIRQIHSLPLRKGVLQVWELAVKESGEGIFFRFPSTPR